ncbi:MAG: hypothetical protein Q9181_007780, partial [Wetmoreana brouardii]
ASTSQGTVLWDTPKFLEPWTDFEYESLQSIYDGSLHSILQSRFELLDYSRIPKVPSCEIFDEASLQSLLEAWNKNVVNQALSKAQNKVDTLSGEFAPNPIYMVKGGQASFPNIGQINKKEKADSTNRYQPDWAGVQKPAGCRGRQRNILPGDTKPSVKELLAIRIRPMPMATSSSTTHGVIFPKDASEPASRRILRAGGLEFKWIPWDNGGQSTEGESRGMTINLALWWLHTMAAAGSEIEDDYPALKDAKRGHGKIKERSRGNGSFRNGKPQTPRSRQLPASDLNQSFRSDTSNLRRRFSDVSLDQDESSTRATRRRKRARQEPVETRSRARRRKDDAKQAKQQ